MSTEIYLPKVAAGLSIFGSSIIICEVIKDMRSERGTTSVSRILLSMSVGDIIFSFGWFLGTWPSPSDLDYLQGTNHGTYETCQFQGFIVQFGGFAALFFNASLALVYLLMTKHNWREKRIQNLEQKLQTLIWIFCLTTSIIPIPLDMYHSAGPLCWVAPYPLNCTQTFELESPDMETDCTAGDGATIVSLALQVLPVWICIFIDSIIMCAIYQNLRNLHGLDESETDRASSCWWNIGPCPFSKQQQRQSENHTRDNDEIENEEEGERRDIPDGNFDSQQISTNDETTVDDRGDALSGNAGSTSTSTAAYKQRTKRSRIVARQGMWYISGFLLTFGLSTLSVIVFFATGSWQLEIDRTSYFFMALQGVWNFLIYSRRREMKTAVGRRARTFVWGIIFGCGRRVKCCKMRPRLPTANSSPHVSGINNHCTGEGSIPQRQRQKTTLPPTDEIGEEETGSRRNNSWFSIIVHHWGRHNHLVSELGASGVSEDVSSFDVKADPPLRPRRLVSEGDGAPPAKPVRVESEVEPDSSRPFPSKLHRFHSDFGEAPPTKPLRLESEAEGDVEIPSTLKHRVIHKGDEAPPSMPVRLQSEVTHKGDEAPPSMPVRLHSEVTHKGDEAPPSMPVRLQSEVESEVEAGIQGHLPLKHPAVSKQLAGVAGDPAFVTIMRRKRN